MVHLADGMLWTCPSCMVHLAGWDIMDMSLLYGASSWMGYYGHVLLIVFNKVIMQDSVWFVLQLASESTVDSTLPTASHLAACTKPGCLCSITRGRHPP